MQDNATYVRDTARWHSKSLRRHCPADDDNSRILILTKLASPWSSYRAPISVTNTPTHKGCAFLHVSVRYFTADIRWYSQNRATRIHAIWDVEPMPSMRKTNSLLSGITFDPLPSFLQANYRWIVLNDLSLFCAIIWILSRRHIDWRIIQNDLGSLR